MGIEGWLPQKTSTDTQNDAMFEKRYLVQNDAMLDFSKPSFLVSIHLFVHFRGCSSSNASHEIRPQEGIIFPHNAMVGVPPKIPILGEFLLWTFVISLVPTYSSEQLVWNQSHPLFMVNF